MDRANRSRWIVGVLLIVTGLGLYWASRVQPLGKGAILLVLGAAFVATYLGTKRYFALVVGGILAGLGAGAFGGTRLYLYGEATNLGLGAGFILIWLVALLWERRSHWWPLIPGSILVLLGLRTWGRAWRFLVGDGWPLILVIVGALVLLGALGKPRKEKRQS